jgi:hypothetical protein
MAQLTIENSLAEKLTESTQLYDPAGKLVGQFLTPLELARLQVQAMNYEFEHETREEALADCAKNGVVSSEEADARIEARRARG